MRLRRFRIRTWLVLAVSAAALTFVTSAQAIDSGGVTYPASAPLNAVEAAGQLSGTPQQKVRQVRSMGLPTSTSTYLQQTTARLQ